MALLLQPPGWGVSLSLDWYDVKITNAIQALSGQTIANECVDLSTIDNPFCGQVTRTPTGGFPGSISQIRAQEINVASFQTSGIDLDFDYTADTTDWFGENDGTISFHIIGNWLNRLSFVSLPDEAPVQGAGTLGGGFDGTPAPKWQTNVDIVWRNNGWTVDYNIDWYSHVLRTSLQTVKDQPNVFAKQFLFIPDRFVQGVQVGYDFSPGWNAYVGIDNLFYQKPAIGRVGLSGRSDWSVLLHRRQIQVGLQRYRSLRPRYSKIDAVENGGHCPAIFLSGLAASYANEQSTDLDDVRLWRTGMRQQREEFCAQHSRWRRSGSRSPHWRKARPSRSPSMTSFRTS